MSLYVLLRSLDGTEWWMTGAENLAGKPETIRDVYSQHMFLVDVFEASGWEEAKLRQSDLMESEEGFGGYLHWSLDLLEVQTPDGNAELVSFYETPLDVHVCTVDELRESMAAGLPDPRTKVYMKNLVRKIGVVEFTGTVRRSEPSAGTE